MILHRKTVFKKKDYTENTHKRGDRRETSTSKIYGGKYRSEITKARGTKRKIGICFICLIMSSHTSTG